MPRSKHDDADDPFIRYVDAGILATPPATNPLPSGETPPGAEPGDAPARNWARITLALLAVLLAIGVIVFFVLVHGRFHVDGFTSIMLVLAGLGGLGLLLSAGNKPANWLDKNLVLLLVPVVLVGFFVTRVDFNRSASAAPSIPIEDLKIDVPTATEQVVVVSAPSLGVTDATLQTFTRTGNGPWTTVLGPVNAHLGRGGFSANRREADGTTPSGHFDLAEAFGNKSDPGTRLPYRSIGRDDWWVSDSTSASYNTWQTHAAPVPWNAARGEHLIEFGRAYNYAVAINFNRPDPTPGLGSAIFLHVDTGNPTSGCVSIGEDQLVSILKWLDPAKHPQIVMGEERLLLKANDAPPVVAGATGGIAPLAPKRLLDTRSGIGATTGALGARSTLDLTVAGGTTTVPADAAAVALNVTLTEQTEATYLTVYPRPADTTEGPPLVSNVNGVPSEHRANMVFVAVGADRQVRIYNFAGRAHVVADVVGYVSLSTPGRYQPVPTYRILDTRADTLKGVTTPAPVRGGKAGELEVAVPFAPAGATAAVVNVTAVQPSVPTFVAAFAGDATWADTSSVNSLGRENSANLTIVALSATDTIRLRNGAGATDVLVDVQGFLMPSGDRFVVARTPVRVLDTRSGVGVRGIVGPGELVRVRVGGLPPDATAVAVTVTGVDATAGTFIQAGSNDGTTSNVNLRAEDTRANLAIVAVVNGFITFSNHSGSLHVVADVTGWLAPG